MANNDFTPYKLSTSAEEADKGIVLAALAAKTPGILIFDGHGGAKSAVPGNDYGLPMINGNGPPSANTAATLGQHYFNMLATRPPYEYICTGLIESGYVWRVYGDTGVNFAPVGRFLTLDDLQAAIEAGLVPEPTPGVSYYIGAAEPYDVYVYDGVAHDWLNIGALASSGDSTGGAGALPPHGDEGDILSKLSGADYDAGWVPLLDVIADDSIPGTKLADDSIPGTKLADDSINKAKLGADVEILSFTNKAVAVSAWVANSTYADWGFRASIACTGVTTKHYAEVIFAPADATSGEFCPANNTYNGGVYIYAANKPTATITIPLIVATPLS